MPDAPSSINGFLPLHRDLQRALRKTLFTTYANGEQTHAETTDLPFDPTEDFHDYTFFYDEESITFYVDGEPVPEFEGGLPEERTKLYVNSWFPRWLSGEEPHSERYIYVDWIEY